VNRDRLLIPSENRGKDPVSPTTPAAAQAPAAGAFLPAKFGSFNFLSYLCTEMSKRREKNKPQQPQMNRQLEQHTEGNEKPDHSIAFEAGKFCLDIAKLVFGGVILAGIMQQGIEFNSLFLTGLAVVLLFVVFGFYLIKK